MGWEKIIANKATDKGLISKTYKQLNILKKKLNQKMGIRLNKHFSKEDTHLANKHIKRSSTSLIIREMHIKTTMRYHLTLGTMSIIKNP